MVLDDMVALMHPYALQQVLFAPSVNEKGQDYFKSRLVAARAKLGFP